MQNPLEKTKYQMKEHEKWEDDKINSLNMISTIKINAEI